MRRLPTNEETRPVAVTIQIGVPLRHTMYLWVDVPKSIQSGGAAVDYAAQKIWDKLDALFPDDKSY
jgi:hypothetical protein